MYISSVKLCEGLVYNINFDIRISLIKPKALKPGVECKSKGNWNSINKRQEILWWILLPTIARYCLFCEHNAWKKEEQRKIPQSHQYAAYYSIRIQFFARKCYFGKIRFQKALHIFRNLCICAAAIDMHKQHSFSTQS